MQTATHTANRLSADQLIAHGGLKPGMKVAELGCGSGGYFVYPIAKAVGNDGEVFALDVQKKLLETIERRARDLSLHNVIPIWSDLEVYGAAHIPEGSVDVAFFVNTLFQIKNKGVALKEAARVLKKGGTLVIVDWNKRLKCPYGPGEVKCFDQEELFPLAPPADLTHVDSFTLAPYYWGAIFKKE